MNLKNVTLISLSDFEDKELLTVKSSRSFVEYYWTCTPSLPLFIFKRNPEIEKVIYLDADLFFYSPIDLALEELGNQSILTTEHHFPKGQESRIKTSGRFNVAFQIFNRDEESLECLRRWRKQCLEWCYWRFENGKLGDQLYLNEWPKLYKHLVISKNLGINAAPWNIKRFQTSKIRGNIFINNDKLVCYHFHQFVILGEKSFERSLGYYLSKKIVEYIYKPYEEEVMKQIKEIKKMDQAFIIIGQSKNIITKIKQSLFKLSTSFYWSLQALLK